MKHGLVLAAVLLATALPAASRSAPADPCAAADDVAGVIAPLPHVAAALQPGHTLDILAIGSASLFGPEASLARGSVTNQVLTGTPPKIGASQVISTPPSETAFPQLMVRTIETAVPGLTVRIKVRGGRGLTAADQLGLMDQALDEGKVQLVLWQTGTIEAVRNTPPAEFGQTLAEGAAHVERAGADLILIDPQFSRFLQTNSNIEPYEQALQQMGSLPGVMLFHRFDLMRAWVNDGQIDLERTPKADRKRVVEVLHACIGARLGRMIVAGARS